MSLRFEVTYVIVAVVSVSLHEVSHGYVANFFGDPTARNAGRLTLNPLRHVDPFGTVILPLLLVLGGMPPFGYARPVPVTVSRLRKPRSQSLYVALAGPLTNLVLVAIASGIIRVLLALYPIHFPYTVIVIEETLFILGAVNLTLAAFNLLPIPPLDGSALVERMIPTKSLARYWRLRNGALPIVFVLLIADALSNNYLGHLLGSLRNWYLLTVFSN